MNLRTKSLISAIAGFSALGLLLMALIYWAVFTTPAFNLNIGQWDIVLRVLMVLTIVAFSVYLITAPESVGTAVGKRSTRLTANALVASLVAIGIGIALNIIIANVPDARADLTAGQDFTLSDQTLKVIQAIDARGKAVDAVAFFSDQVSSGTSRQQMEDLLKEYSSHSSKIKYEFVDPLASPARVTELGVTTNGSVIFDDGTKRESATTIDEASFTSALALLLDSSTKTVAFLTGHGERDPNGTTENDYSSVQTTLQHDNYKVISWNLVTSPTITLSNVTVLVIAAPQKALTDNETKAIQSYLDGGGHVLMNLDPQMPAEALKPMASILSKYGVTPVEGVVLDLAKSASTQDQSVVLVNTFPDSPITADISKLGESLVFPAALGLKPPTSTVAGMVVTPIIQSSPSQDQSWLETNLQSQQVTFDAATDIPGPVTMGLTIAPDASTTDTNTTTPKTKLVVFADADYAGNFAVQQVPANGDLMANSVSWLAGANDLVSIRAKAPSAPRTLTLDATQKNFLGISTIFAMPLLVLLAGALIWWRRK